MFKCYSGSLLCDEYLRSLLMTLLVLLGGVTTWDGGFNPHCIISHHGEEFQGLPSVFDCHDIEGVEVWALKK